MRLTPDVRKMVISTLYGYLVVIHDLDLSTMSKDLAGQFLSNLFVVLWIRIHWIRIRNAVLLYRFYVRRSVPALGFGSDLVSKFQIKPDPGPNMGYRTAYGINAMLLCAGFKPNMYRLMQTTGKTLEMAVNFTKLFHAKRNRQQFLSFLLRLTLVQCPPYFVEVAINLISIQFMCSFTPKEIGNSFCLPISVWH